MLPHLFFKTNLISSGLLSRSDADAFLAAALEHARPATLVGGTSTSLEAAGTKVDYRLLDGNAVAKHIPELQKLYEGAFREMAEKVFGVSLVVSPDLVSGANVNVLEGNGGRYEWHFDSNPYTGLLVLSPSSATLGGRLFFGREEDVQVKLSMEVGDLLFFDAREAAHAVEPLANALTRATVPMNYFPEGEAIVRPDDLDRTLYG